MSRVPLSVDKRRALSLKMKKIQSDPQRREHLLFKEDIQVISNAINYLNIHKGV